MQSCTLLSARIRRALRLLVYLILALMTMPILASAQQAPEEPPGVNFSAAPLAGVAPLTVTFNNLSTGAVTDYLWDFGDGVTSTLENPTHVYTAPGSHNVSLMINGPGGTDAVRRGGYVLVRTNSPAPMLPNPGKPYHIHVFRDPPTDECTTYVDLSDGSLKPEGLNYYRTSLFANQWFTEAHTLSADDDPVEDLVVQHDYLFCHTFDPSGTEQHYEFSSSYSGYGGYKLEYSAYMGATSQDDLLEFSAQYAGIDWWHPCISVPDEYEAEGSVSNDIWSPVRFGYKLKVSASVDPTFCGELEVGIAYDMSIRFFGDGGTNVFPWSMGLAPCECPFSCVAANCQGWQGGPINTQSGNYHYSQEDVSIPALGGPLSFERSYNSLLRDVDDAGLGHGWTHNYAVRLFFTDELEQRPDTVIVQGCRGSRFPFYDHGDDTFSPYPGVWATLTFDEATHRYLLRGVDQSTYIFDDAGHLVEIRDPQEQTLTLSYTDGSLSRVADATGARYLDFGHDAQGRIIATSDHAGRVTEYGYDGNGDLTVMTTTLDTPAQPAVWSYAYSDAHQLHEIRNPADELIERTEYDTQSRAVRQWTADSANPLTIEYGTGGVVTATDTLGRQTVDVYNARNTLISQTLPGSSTTQRAYDGGFNPTYTRAHANYNAMGRPEYFEDALGNTTQVAYDERAQPLAITDARDATSTYTYDGAQLTHITDALDGETANTYDPTTGLLIQSVNHGLTTTYAYDAYGQRTVVTDAAGLATHYAYDDVGRLITTTASNGLLTVNAYDTGDRLIRVTRNVTTTGGPNHLGAYNLTSEYAYDLAGRTILVTDTLGLVTYNRYDDAGRLIAATSHYSPALYPAHGASNASSRDAVWNRTTQYAYDGLGRQTHVTNTLGSVTFTEYDEAGHVWRVWQNYRAGQPQNWQETYNLLTEYGYDLAGNQTHVTDTLGTVTRTDYDALGRAVRVTENYVIASYPGHGPHNDQNLSTRYGYDAVGNQTHVTTTLGTVTLTDYDLLNRPVTVTVLFYERPLRHVFLPLVLRGDGATTVASTLTSAVPARNGALGSRRIVQQVTLYDPVTGRVSRTLDALGRATAYEYDQAGRNVAVIANYVDGVFDPAHPDEDVRQETEYDPETGRVVQTIAAANVPDARRVTRHAYDDAGRPVTVTTNYDASVNSGHYDPAHPDLNRGQVTVYEPHTGRVAANLDIAESAIPTTYGYDLAGRLITTTDALSGTTVTEYDILGRRTAVTDAGGRRTVYEYDTAGRQVAVTRNYVDSVFDPAHPDEDLRETMHYDALGRRVGQTDAMGHTTVFSYDGAGRLRAQADPLGNVTTYEYDAQGNRTRITDPDGVVTTYAYDGLNRRTSSCDALGNCVSYVYDDAGQRIQITAANGIVTRYEYDGQGRLTAVVENYVPGASPNRQTNVRTEYRYDAHGNLLEIRDTLNHITSYAYDLAGERVSESDALGHVTAHTYDGHGRRVRSVYPDAGETLSVETEYDALGRPTQVSYPAVGALPGFSVAYAYTPLGQRTAVTDSGGTTTYAYDDLYRPEEIAAPTGAVQYRYDALGRRVNLIYPGGEVVTYTHDAADRLIRVTDWEGRDVDYTYTPAGRLQSLLRPNGVTSVYTYDEAGRLHSLTHSRGAEVLSSYVYTLDAMGNRVQAEETISGTTRVITYSYDPLSRLTGANYSTGEAYAYQYDAVGNRTAMTTTTIQLPPSTIHYAYDAANRLTSIRLPDSSIQSYSWDERGNLISDGENTYDYDSAGRMRRAVTAGGTLDYTYNSDGLRVMQGADTFTWDWASGVPELLSDGESVYLVGDDTLAWQTGDNNWIYAIPDALGSVRQETDAAGNVIDVREWSPYGEELGGAQEGLGYTGEWQDAYSNLLYLRTRWYDGSIGRFASLDSWRGDPERPQTLNLYEYVENNPIIWADPSGMTRLMVVRGADAVNPAGLAVRLGAATNAKIAFRIHDETKVMTNEDFPSQGAGNANSTWYSLVRIGIDTPSEWVWPGFGIPWMWASSEYLIDPAEQPEPPTPPTPTAPPSTPPVPPENSKPSSPPVEFISPFGAGVAYHVGWNFYSNNGNHKALDMVSAKDPYYNNILEANGPVFGTSCYNEPELSQAKLGVSGREVYAIVSGRVQKWHGGFDLYATIQEKKYLIQYVHVNYEGPEGEVSQGAFLGYYAKWPDGWSSIPHLHLGIKENGIWIDPFNVLPPR